MAVQIDHVVAPSDAWQTGAARFAFAKRMALANDPLNLLAVAGPTNARKSDGDAATWLPPNRSNRCAYVRPIRCRSPLLPARRPAGRSTRGFPSATT
jgi:hypothetical protein